MKKFFMAVIALMMTISASAQFYIYYSDGTVAKVDSISMVAPEDEPDTPVEPEEPTTPSTGIGVFSVAEGRTVTFSPGNLQYHPANIEWRFAPCQLDYIGEANENISSTYNGWLDLFGWSTSSTNFGVSTSTFESYYSGSFVDWGTNKIGNDAPNTWRTLTLEEWHYLRYTRTNADDLVGVAQVNGVNGLVLLPDDWTCPSGITFKSGFHSERGVDYYAAYQTFTAAEWSKLESAGAVFLPAAGDRDGSNVYEVQDRGFYWSATEGGSNSARFLYFNAHEAEMIGRARMRGQSVRLVKDIEGGITTPDKPTEPDTPTEKPTTPYFSVSSTKFVTFSPGNLQYHPANIEWRFAPCQLDYIGKENENISSTYNGWLDLFGWSTSATNFGVSTSTDWENDYLGSFVDWGTNKIGNDAPNTWRTLTLYEWYYLQYDRPHASSLKGVAQVNGVNGFIFLPDNWVCPSGITFKSGAHSERGVDYYAAYQTFTADQWSKLEAAGAVFLPASGRRYGSGVDYVQYRGYYWSATDSGLSNYASFLDFYSSGENTHVIYRYNGHSVRLVKEL